MAPGTEHVRGAYRVVKTLYSGFARRNTHLYAHDFAPPIGFLLYGAVSGNKEAREATEPFFFIPTQREFSHFYMFEHCVRYYARVLHRVFSASCVVSIQRRI